MAGYAMVLEEVAELCVYAGVCSCKDVQLLKQDMLHVTCRASSALRTV
jgi:hypothetical protein